MLDTIRRLSVVIGPRPSASQAEGRAADWCLEQLDALGFETRLQVFPAVASLTTYMAPIYTASALAGTVLTRGFRRFAALLSVPAALLFYLEQSYRPILSSSRPRAPSTNVVAHLPDRREHRQTVVLTAHLDTQHAGLAFHPRVVSGFRQRYLLLSAGLVWTAVASLWRLWRPRSDAGWIERVVQAATLNTVGALALLLHRQLFLPHVDGANDNASGVAVVLAAADALASRLEYTSLWVVLTGSEETGSHGMLHFLDTHAFDPRYTYFINCDTCGAGHVAVIDHEGPLKSYAADATLLAVARQIIARDELDAEVRSYHLLGTDVEAALERGYRGMSIMAFDDDGRLPNWHWTTDTAEHIEPATLETACRLVTKLVLTLDERRGTLVPA